MRLALGVLLGAAAGVIAMTRRSPSGHRPPQPRYPGDQRAGPSGDRDQPPAHGEPYRPAPRPTAGEKAAPGDERQKKGERIYWWVTGSASILATGATIAAAGFAAGAYLATREQADTAQAALVAADRPWLKIENVSVAEVSMNPLGATIRLSVKAKNIGRSPALRGLALVEVMPDMGDGEPARLAAPLCRRAAADRNLAEVEGVVFPDAERETDYLRFVLPADVRAAVDRVQRREAAEDGRRRPAEPTPVSLRTQLAVVGCATYAFQAGKAIGQTAFVYGLARNCGPPPHEWPCDFDLSENGDFSGAEIVVQKADFAGFAR